MLAFVFLSPGSYPLGLADDRRQVDDMSAGRLLAEDLSTSAKLPVTSENAL